jgi:hypothetical protein
MKNLQTKFLTFLLIYWLPIFATDLMAQNQKITLADSLFKAKQYTQSLEYYQSALDSKTYSPAMLLKMAYINEGLGKIGSTMYYLKLYELAIGEDQVSQKTAELATKFNLSGYESKKFSPLRWLLRNLLVVQFTLALVLLSLVVALVVQRRQRQKPWITFSALILVIGLLFYLNNYSVSTEVIVVNKNAYLMEGPSAGSNVSAVVGEGHLLQSFGHEDIWLKIKWEDKTVFLKEYDALTVAL